MRRAPEPGAHRSGHPAASAEPAACEHRTPALYKTIEKITAKHRQEPSSWSLFPPKAPLGQPQPVPAPRGQGSGGDRGPGAPAARNGERPKRAAEPGRDRAFPPLAGQPHGGARRLPGERHRRPGTAGPEVQGPEVQGPAAPHPRCRGRSAPHLPAPTEKFPGRPGRAAKARGCRCSPLAVPEPRP